MSRVSLPKSRALRWAVPAALAAGVAVAATGVLTATADPPLPSRTAAQLLVDLQNPDLSGLSGTIVQKADLGLPELPTGGRTGGTSLAGLLTGSHTMRVWAAGPDKQRVALQSTLGETDLIHNGRHVYMWSSDDNTATHFTVPAGTSPTDLPKQVGLTPQQAAAAALAAIDPTTLVSTDGTASVAGRAAYELVLRPKDGRSLIGQVRLAIDAATRIPLRVQVFGKDSSAGPGAEVKFTRVSTARPGDEQFEFTPPPGTKMEELGDLGHRVPRQLPHQASPADLAGGKLIGAGWTAVAVLPGGADATGPLGALFEQVGRVQTPAGGGRLLGGKLFNALLLDDGRLLVGAVDRQTLIAAAGR